MASEEYGFKYHFINYEKREIYSTSMKIPEYIKHRIFIISDVSNTPMKISLHSFSSRSYYYCEFFKTLKGEE